MARSDPSILSRLNTQSAGSQLSQLQDARTNRKVAQSNLKGAALNQEQQQLNIDQTKEEMKKAKLKKLALDTLAFPDILDAGDKNVIGKLGLHIREQLIELNPNGDTKTIDRVLHLAANDPAAAAEFMRQEIIPSVEATNRELFAEQHVKPSDTEGGQTFSRDPRTNIVSATDIVGAKEDAPGKIVQRFPFGGGEAESILSDGKGGFTDLAGKSIKLDPKDRLIAGSSLTGGEDELGLTDTEGRGLRDAEVSARNLIGSINEAAELIRNTPNINTAVARMASITNGLKTEARALSEEFGFEFKADLFDPKNYEGTFKELGVKNAQMKGLITGLAYELATSREGGRLSDRDVENAIRELGANSSDPVAFSAVIQDVARRTERNFQNNFQVRTGTAFTGDLGVRQEDEFDPATATDDELIQRALGN